MTAPDTKAIRARADAATAGPWHACGEARGGCVCGYVWSKTVDRPVVKALRRDEEMGDLFTQEQQAANALFSSAAREDVPALCARVEALEAALRKTLAALEVATTPLARDRTEVVDAMRVARAALEGR